MLFFFLFNDNIIVGDSMKKGFTLIELLAVLVLVGSLFTIVISMISGQIKNSEKEINESEIKTFCAAAKLYVNKEDYSSKLTEIKLETLEKNGILTNLNDKYKNKSIYVQYVGNYFCCCSSKYWSTCNQEICKGTVKP